MHIVVLIKHVLDPEIPARAFRVDRRRKVPDVPRAAQTMSIFDGNALELALKLREQRSGDTKITAVTLGDRLATDVLRKALALTADAAVLISDSALDGLDSVGKARVLAAAVQKLAPVEIVIAGRQAADWEDGQVGGMLAEVLGWPCLSFVSQLTISDEAIQARREIDDGYQVYRLAGPTVLTATNSEHNVPRIAKVRDAMLAARKPITTWTASDLGVSADELKDTAVELVDLFVPEPPKRAEMIDGETAAERARRLAQRMRELNLI
ncbi:MAG TPA: electron transfer flavoprotein subunit beta/FixA family protein [Chloroflexota bacterium]|jgi:electron transfer flavoprotein beta subunit|nr:electron transfer flavoprotein subunit beta/FixA family protein [Chloroflexota bacterium]